jgi:hypothetical protein
VDNLFLLLHQYLSSNQQLNLEFRISIQRIMIMWLLIFELLTRNHLLSFNHFSIFFSGKVNLLSIPCISKINVINWIKFILLLAIRAESLSYLLIFFIWICLLTCFDTDVLCLHFNWFLFRLWQFDKRFG